MLGREQAWSSLDDRYDVLIVGGGVTGCGIARDAARRGLKTALVEMGDLASGTSSRSSKLVHGGLRYLEHYEFSLVFEAVSERRVLREIAPHLVRPLGFLFPVYKDSRHKLWLINAGMWLYDGLSLFRSPKVHRNLDPKEVKEEEPGLNQEGLTGAPLYFDCATDDARITLENALDAREHGATVLTYVRCEKLLHDERGRIVGAVVNDLLTGDTKTIRADAVVNATGPWTDETLERSAAPPANPLLRPTKGVHIVVDSHRLPLTYAVVCFHPEDGRVLFAIPWGEQTYIGTTDTDFNGDPSEVHATRDDVLYLLAASNDAFPGAKLVPKDVIATWAGLRPLMRPMKADANVDESAVSREHQVVIGRDGLITIAGGKLTTYRRMAAEVVDTAVKLLRLGDRLPKKLRPARTDEEPLPGAVGWPEDDEYRQVLRYIVEASDRRLSTQTAEFLAGMYGMCAVDVARIVASDPSAASPIVEGRMEIMAQVDWAVSSEFACEVGDVMTRRTQIFFRDADQGLSAVSRVGARMAEQLGWDDQRRSASEAGYRKAVADARAWRND